MTLTFHEALWLLPGALPVAIWIAWSDLKFMKITNRATLVMAAVFLVFGFIALPVDQWLWRLVQLAIVLLIGFGANMLRLIGGGDAKYAAAIAAYVAPEDIKFVLILFAAMLVAALISHRIFRAIPFIRSRTQDWLSWHAGKDFPMGLALSGTLIAYLFIGLMNAG